MKLLVLASGIATYAQTCGGGGGTVPPEPAPSQFGAQQIALGAYGGCAVVQPKTGPKNLQCWGSGSGVKTYPVTPGPSSFFAGWYHQCTVRDNGSVYCQGWNEEGQLGLGYAGASEPVAKQVVDLDDIVAVRMGAGMSTCALASNTDLYCWGSNGIGAVGNGDSSYEDVYSPQKIATGIHSFGVGHEAACAADENGALSCWGSNEVLGVHNTSPTAFAVGGAVKQIAMNNRHSCVLLQDGRVQCWGRRGFLGNGEEFNWTHNYTPQFVTGLSNVVDVSAGRSNACAVKGDGSVWCWGNANAGQMGNGDTSMPAAYVPVQAAIGGVKKVAVGTDNVCAINGEGRVFCWGKNESGNAGHPDKGVLATPIELPLVW